MAPSDLDVIRQALVFSLYTGFGSVAVAFVCWEFLKSLPVLFDRLDYWKRNRNRRLYRENIKLRQLLYRRNRRLVQLVLQVQKLGGKVD